MADFVVLWAVSVHIAKLQLRGLWLSTGDQTAVDGHREVSPISDELDGDEHEIESTEEEDTETKPNIWQVDSVTVYHSLY